MFRRIKVFQAKIASFGGTFSRRTSMAWRELLLWAKEELNLSLPYAPWEPLSPPRYNSEQNQDTLSK